MFNLPKIEFSNSIDVVFVVVMMTVWHIPGTRGPYICVTNGAGKYYVNSLIQDTLNYQVHIWDLVLVFFSICLDCGDLTLSYN